MLIPTLPTTPGVIIGYTRRGPIRLLAGGSGEGEGGEGGDAPATDGGPDDGGPQDGPDEVAQLREELKKARAEAAKSRVNAKQAAAEQARNDVVQQIAKALGLAKDDAPADPAKLAEQLAASQREGQQARIELAVYKAAGKAGADADALLDSRSFLDSLKDVDPADSKQIGDLIKAALDNNPRYRASGQAPAPRGGTEPTGRPSRPGKPASLTDAIAARIRG